MDQLALRLYDLVRQVRVLGPDADGLLWLYVDSATAKASFSVRATDPEAEALLAWREERAALLAAAELESIR